MQEGKNKIGQGGGIIIGKSIDHGSRVKETQTDER